MATPTSTTSATASSTAASRECPTAARASPSAPSALSATCRKWPEPVSAGMWQPRHQNESR
eukprot:1245145-Pyramimonas_sp.AAC.1